MTTALPGDILALLISDLAVVDRWKAIGVHTSTHSISDGAIPPVITAYINANLTLLSEDRAMSFLVQLTGVGAYSSMVINFKGTPFETSDATLLARLSPLVDLVVADKAAEFKELLEATIE